MDEEDRELLSGLDLEAKALMVDNGMTQVSYATAYMQGYSNDNDFNFESLDNKSKMKKQTTKKKVGGNHHYSDENGENWEGQEDEKVVKNKVMKLIKNTENEWEWVEDDLFDQGDEEGSLDGEEDGLLAQDDKHSSKKKEAQHSYSKAFKQNDNND